MSYRFDKQIVRLEVDISRKDDSALHDRITGATPRFGRYAAVRFEVALFFGGELVDISSITAASITVKDSARSVTQMTQTVGAANMNPALTQDQWEAGTHQHLVFEFASTATGIGTGTESTHWLVVHGLTTDVAIFGGGSLKVFDGGITGVTAPPIEDATGITRDEVVAMLSQYLKIVNPAGIMATFTSASGRRTIGIDDDRNPVDLIEEL